MRMLRTYADEGGESHFDEFDVTLSTADFAPPAPPLDLSETYPASKFLIVSVPPGWAGDWHPPPTRQVWIGISGSLRVTTSDGTTRDIPAGTPWFMEDLTGKGHATTAVGDAPAVGAITQLPLGMKLKA